MFLSQVVGQEIQAERKSIEKITGAVAGNKGGATCRVYFMKRCSPAIKTSSMSEVCPPLQQHPLDTPLLHSILDLSRMRRSVCLRAFSLVSRLDHFVGNVHCFPLL